MAKNGLVRLIVGDLSLSTSSPFAKLLDQCIQSKSILECRRVHARIIKTQFSSEVFIQNRLIDAYGKCGFLDDACKLFDKMVHRNTFTYNTIIGALVDSGLVDEAVDVFLSVPEPDQCSWNSIVSGLAQHNRFEEALVYFTNMHKDGFMWNEYSISSALSACAGLVDLLIGIQVHGFLLKSSYSTNVYIGSALVDMYSKCGAVECAQRVCDAMTERNAVTWNSLISCYEQNGPANEAIETFRRMIGSGLKPDEITLASVVSACATVKAITEGREVHAQVEKTERFRCDLILGNALVDMYAKCGRVNEARRIFDRMSITNVISETSMVSGYAKAASVEDAKLLFVKMRDRNIVSWNALMAGYTQSGESEEALGLFCLLKRESVWPTHYTFGNLLSSCANLADLNIGRQAHAHVLKHGLRFQSDPESDIFVENAMIDMYMKCGSVEDGSLVFGDMAKRDHVSWNALIIGYAQNGCGVEALELFKKMVESGERPDHITLVGVLCACSHAGLVDEGRKYFYSMARLYGLMPLKDHYTCMVDLLGRSGCLNEAKNLIESMPMQPDKVVWASLLAACRIHCNIEMGKYVAEKMLEIDPANSGPYVLLSNMYADQGRWHDATSLRKLMRQRGVVKQPGCSWVEVQGRVYTFMVKDRSHHQKKEIYLLLKCLTNQLKLAGYVPVVVDAETEEEQIDSVSTLLYPEIPAIAAMG